MSIDRDTSKISHSAARLPQTIALNEEDFSCIARIAKQNYGLHIEASKRTMIQSRLSGRLQDLGVDDFKSYCALLEENNAAEQRNFISAITTNVTRYFREAHHFDHFSNTVLPTLKRKCEAGERVRLWSCGCSTGPEPFSLAACIIDGFPNAATYDLKLLATDLDEDVLAQAEQPHVTAEQIAPLTPDQKRMLLEHGTDGTSDPRIKREIRDLITFAKLNIQEEFPMSGMFDVIFCRNVLIYFEQENQRSIWRKFAERSRDNGFLYIGHSERVMGGASDLYKQVGTTIYQRQPRSATGI